MEIAVTKPETDHEGCGPLLAPRVPTAGSKLKPILLCALLYNSGISIIMFLHSLLLAELGWREQAVGTVNSVTMLGSLLAVLPMARLARRAGLRSVLSGTLLLAAGSFAARLWITQHALQLCLSFLGGVGLSGWIVCISPSVAEAVPEEDRASAFNLLFAVSLLAGAGGGIVGGFLPQHLLDFKGGHHSLAFAERGSLLVGAALLALAAWPALRLRGAVVEEKRSSASLLRNRQLLRFLLGTSGWNLTLGAFVPFVSFFFARELHVPLPRLSLIFGVVQLTQALGLLGASRLMERKLGPVLTIAALQIAGGLSLLMLAAGRSVAYAAVLYGIFTIFQRLCEPATQWLLMEIVPAGQRSASVAVGYFVATVQQAMAGGLGGYALERLGYPKTLTWLSLLAMGSAITFFVLLRSFAGGFTADSAVNTAPEKSA